MGMDVWWDKKQVMNKRIDKIRAELSKPLVIVAVDAPDMKRDYKRGYNKKSIDMLARKVYMCFAVQDELRCPEMLSGLLGGGDFLGNRALVLLLHCLFQTDQKVIFHNPIFGKHGSELEPMVAPKAEEMMVRLRKRRVRTIGEALEKILNWNIPTMGSSRTDDLTSSYSH